MVKFYLKRIELGKIVSLEEIPERWRQLVADALLPNEA